MTSAHFPTTSTQRAEMALSTLVKPDPSTVSSAQKALNKCWLSSLKRGRKVPVGNYYWKNLNSDTNTEILSRIKKKKEQRGLFSPGGQQAIRSSLTSFHSGCRPPCLVCLLLQSSDILQSRPSYYICSLSGTDFLLFCLWGPPAFKLHGNLNTKSGSPRGTHSQLRARRSAVRGQVH